MIELRDPVSDDLEPLTRLWYAGWHEAHGALVPTALSEQRTLESFATRLQRIYLETRVVGVVGAPVAFCSTKGDEVYQLFVSANARGSGVAAHLLSDAETRLRRRGAEISWLTCVIGNNRAAHFYSKNGWSQVGTMVDQVETLGEGFPIELWRYEKRL